MRRFSIALLLLVVVSASMLVARSPLDAAANTNPIAQDDLAIVDEDTALILENLVANDTDDDLGDVLSISSVDPISAEGGSVILKVTAGHVKYLPAKNFHGIDNFQYQLSDGNGGSDSATVTITVNSINDLPLANAGANQNVHEGDTVILNGRASTDTDGTIASYSWVQTAGSSVNIVDSGSPSPSFMAPAVGAAGEVLGFSLTITDNESATDIATVGITVLDVPPPNQPPIADAGIDKTVNEGDVVTLDGSASNDPDDSFSSMTFTWQQVSGPTILISGADSNQASFIAPKVFQPTGTIVLRLTVSDATGMNDTDEVQVTVQNIVGYSDQNYSPSFTAKGSGSSYHNVADSSLLRLADAFSIAAWFKTSADYNPNGFMLNKGGLGSDAAGQNLNYGLWIDANEKVKGGFETSQGTDKFVTSGKKYNDNKWHFAVVTFNHAAIRLYVDGSQVASLATTTLPDSKSTKPLRIGANSFANNNYFTGQLDEVGLWDRSLSAAEIADQFKFGQFNAAGRIMFFDGVNSTVPPTANAGPDQTVSEGSLVILNGSMSFDPDAGDSIVAYIWTQTAGEHVTLSNRSAPVSDFTAPSPDMTQVLKFRLDVYSSNNEWASDEVSIRVDTNADPRPNFIVVMTDDQRWDTMRYMTNVNNLVAERGLNFTNSFVTTSLCCPSRASFLTGQYAHNHGVLENTPPNGGVTKLDDTSTLATWLHDAGYTTGLIGKYLNGYGNDMSPDIPPGWDDWRVFSTGASASYYNYNLNENGKLVWHGSAQADYSTDVLRDKATSFIRTSERPFFLYLSVYSPHEPTTVAPRHVNNCSSFPLHRPPSFNEANVSDKPNWVKALPLLSASTISSLDSFTKKQMCSLKAVDEAVASIVVELGPEINNTVIIITSDNGYMWGEHRINKRKSCIYEECQRVPLFIIYPKMIVNPEKVDELVVNIDLTATIVDLAQATSEHNLDGKSLVPLMDQAEGSTPVTWRDDVLFEYFIRTGYHSAAVRTLEFKYVELGTGEREFYNLTLDPYELTNAINDPSYSSIIEQLRQRLSQLKID